MGKFDKHLKQKPKLERQQLRSRKRLGALEKHNDYQVRSRKQHMREDSKKYHEDLIRNKNPDEYHSDMKFARKDATTGVTIVSRLPSGDADLAKLKKTKKKNILKNTRSNISLLGTREQILRKKIEKLKQELNFGLVQGTERRKYRINASSKEQVENFSLEEHFQTPLLGTTTRYTLDDLLEKDISEPNAFRSDAKTLKKYQRLKKYIEELKVIQEATTDITNAQHYITRQDQIESVERKDAEVDETEQFYKAMRREESLFTESYGYETEENLAEKLKNVENIKFKRVRQK